MNGLSVESGYILYFDKNCVDLIWFKVSRIIGFKNIRSRWMFSIFDEKLYINKKKYQILIYTFIIPVKNHFFKNQILKLIREYFRDQARLKFYNIIN